MILKAYYYHNVYGSVYFHRQAKSSITLMDDFACLWKWPYKDTTQNYSHVCTQSELPTILYFTEFY
jgi:hypothetical protein